MIFKEFEINSKVYYFFKFIIILLLILIIYKYYFTTNLESFTTTTTVSPPPRTFTMLSKVYLGRILRPDEEDAFAADLPPHQRALGGDRLTPFSLLHLPSCVT